LSKIGTFAILLLTINLIYVFLADIQYKKHYPSMVCSAMMAALRVLTKVEPLWPDRLKTTTQYTYGDLHELVRAMVW